MSETQPIPMAAVVKLQVEPAWLALPRAERRRIVGGLLPILKKYSDVEVEWYDSDALGSGYTDFAIHRFADLTRYHFLWEELRDTELFTHPYMAVVDVTFGLERAFEAFEQAQAEEAAA